MVVRENLALDTDNPAMISEALAIVNSTAADQLIDWHAVALWCGVIIVGCAGLITAICGWVWISTMSWLRRISEDFTQHVKDDNTAFSDVKALISDTHISTLNAINQSRVGRHDDERTDRR